MVHRSHFCVVESTICIDECELYVDILAYARVDEFWDSSANLCSELARAYSNTCFHDMIYLRGLGEPVVKFEGYPSEFSCKCM